MSKISVVSILSVITLAAAMVSTQAGAVSITNRDAAPVKVQFVDGTETTNLEIPAGQEANICVEGCKVIVNGKSMETKGEEALEIVAGVLQAAKK
jgi:hypothetical protein